MPAGPSTSPRTDPGGLTRPEFAKRLFARVQSRYGLELGDAWLHDLIKDGLVQSGVRSRNKGRRPSYLYDRRSYRRALQIARLRRDGIVEKDAIRIMLFVNGYSETDIREALWNVYSKTSRNLLSQIRSTYADNWKPVPPGHLSSLMESFGQLDKRLDEAGFRLPDGHYVRGLRFAKNPAENIERIDVKEAIRKLKASKVTTFDAFADQFLPLLAGLLYFSEAGDREICGLDYIKKLIELSDGIRYESSKRLYYNFIKSVRNAENYIKSVGDDVSRQPEWIALILVVGLLFKELDSGSDRSAEVKCKPRRSRFIRTSVFCGHAFKK